jgi:hypothetical protein
MTMQNFDDMQKYSKDHVDSTMKAWNQVSKGVQALAAETADYSKRFFEEGCATLQKLRSAKSLETVIEIQTTHAKTAYEGLVAQATKMGGIYMNLAQETSKSFENFIPKVPGEKRPPDGLLRAETERSRNGA